MRVLILGGTGMLGHKLYQRLPFECFASVRGSGSSLLRFGFFCPDQVLDGIDAGDMGSVERAVNAVSPDVVVNCIGIVKQSALAKDSVACIETNALFPHRLHAICSERGARLVHVSTDCVFDGAHGGYSEKDAPNATDLYGRSKAMGEVKSALTLRTSIIGRELNARQGLVEWFLSQRGGCVRGFSRAYFSGVTTDELARVITKVLTGQPDLRGVWQVASKKIDKCSLLGLLDEAYGAGVEIVRDETVCVDRSLDGSAFESATGYVAPEWRQMIADMASDPSPYDRWKEK